MTILDTQIAIKLVKFAPESGARASESALMPQLNKWLRLWGSLEHENITKMLGSAFVNDVPSVITPWCTGGNIAQYLEKTPQADRRSLVSIISCQCVQHRAEMLNAPTASPSRSRSKLPPYRIPSVNTFQSEACKLSLLLPSIKF